MPPSHARLLDQFYTDRPLAKTLVAQVMAHVAQRPIADVKWLEPSAGDGAFLDALPATAVGMDVDPKSARIVKADFTRWSPAQDTIGQWAVVGNPPFGKNASLAIAFFNRAARFAEMIAFIVPRTFEKESVHRRLDLSFDLVEQTAIHPDSFLLDGEPVAVPCVFQIWRKRADGTRRVHAAPVRDHADFTYVERAQADFAFQRVGAAAGTVKALTAKSLAPASHHFLRVTDRSQVQAVRRRLASIDWSEVKGRSAGNPSISKTELVAHYRAHLPPP